MGTPPTSVSCDGGTPCVFIAYEEPSRSLGLYQRLRSAGLRAVVLRAGAGGSPLRQIHHYAPDVVVLAVTSDRAPWDAVALARTLRHQPDRPGILFITDRPCEAAELCLADDYVSEARVPAELALRIEVLLTRRTALSDAHRPPLRTPPDLQILTESRRVLRHGHEVALTATEFDILHLLATHTGRVVPKTEILDRVWHHDFNGESNIVEAYICTLRRKLSDTDRTLIGTVRGVGYLLKSPLVESA